MVTRHLGSVAQLVERSTENRKVTGSTPVGATTGKHQFFGTGAFLLLTRHPLNRRTRWWSLLRPRRRDFNRLTHRVGVRRCQGMLGVSPLVELIETRA